MEKGYNTKFTILNYQGSKTNLMEFIYNNINHLVDKDKAVLDMFSGSGAVSYALKKNFKIYSNDSEYYSSIISRALLKHVDKNFWNKIYEFFEKDFKKNLDQLTKLFDSNSSKENEYLKCDNTNDLIQLYKSYPTAWKENLNLKYECNELNNISDIRLYKDKLPFLLFTTYYASTYFGIYQSIEIDSIRYAIENVEDDTLKDVLLASLFYSMKECVFSKDGHMAQPLDLDKNTKKLMKVRNKSIYDNFILKLNEFNSEKFYCSDNGNKIFNYKADALIEIDEISNDVGLIYADPPYTDMQYSRYYHLLNTVALYDYDDISYNGDSVSKGLYRKDRFQSPLSQRSNAPNQIKNIMNFAKNNKINLVLSYAYPRNKIEQATDRYTMKIDDLISMAEEIFGQEYCEVINEEYSHSNNRNSKAKKVLEYLIICRGEDNVSYS